MEPMASTVSSASATKDVVPPEGTIVDIDVTSEMEASFLEYAYSVIYARALPDARDGLKPVQRRILYMMDQMGLRPDRGHVKSQRVVGEVMGKLHPHGDAAIYDALVRMAQDFSMRLPLVDGHGNFGSLDNGPAAARYTEARLAPAAQLLTATLDEDVVDHVPNYDNQLMQPEVLPAQFPNLLVNGASGIAVGMATNMAPHNLVEVIAAARHLLAHPDAELEALMRFVPGPDLPSGGRIIGLDGIRDAYAKGRGSFRMRATARIENVTSRRKGIVITELPYQVGPEKVAEKLRDAVQAKKVQGISDYQDLTDRHHGLRLVMTVKSGYNPEAVLEQLYKHTPLEESFGMNNVALVEGQPRTLGLKQLLEVFLSFRVEVVRRRTEHRLGRAQDRLHLVEGLLIAILDIDEVIQIIRAADDAATARTRLMTVFDLSERQAEYILELRLRRLTKFSQIELEGERDELRAQIERLEAILASREALHEVVSTELAAVAAEHGNARRTVLLEAQEAPRPAAAESLEVPDSPCRVLVSGTGLIARTEVDDSDGTSGSGGSSARDAGRAKHDVVVSAVTTTTRGTVGVITDRGRVLRLPVVDLPSLPASSVAPSLSGGTRLDALVALADDESVLGIIRQEERDLARGGSLVLATRGGVVKRVALDVPKAEEYEVIALKDGDRLVGAVDLEAEQDLDVVLVTSAAHLLHFPISGVRPQGRGAGGVAGVKLTDGAEVIGMAVVDVTREADVVTVAGSSGTLPYTQTGSLKVSAFTEYPAKGRATGGVRCHRFLRGEDVLIGAWVVPHPARACAASGEPIDLPAPVGRRDGSGSPVAIPIAAVG